MFKLIENGAKMKTSDEIYKKICHNGIRLLLIFVFIILCFFVTMRRLDETNSKIDKIEKKLQSIKDTK